MPHRMPVSVGSLNQEKIAACLSVLWHNSDYARRLSQEQLAVALPDTYKPRLGEEQWACLADILSFVLEHKQASPEAVAKASIPNILAEDAEAFSARGTEFGVYLDPTKPQLLSS